MGLIKGLISYGLMTSSENEDILRKACTVLLSFISAVINNLNPTMNVPHCYYGLLKWSRPGAGLSKKFWWSP